MEERGLRRAKGERLEPSGIARGQQGGSPGTKPTLVLALVAFGRGNVPPVIMPAVRDAVAAGVLVTVSSRCVAGRVRPRYGYAGGGHDLAEAGAILAGDLSGAKARLLLMVALGTDTRAFLKAAIR